MVCVCVFFFFGEWWIAQTEPIYLRIFTSLWKEILQRRHDGRSRDELNNKLYCPDRCVEVVNIKWREKKKKRNKKKKIGTRKYHNWRGERMSHKSRVVQCSGCCLRRVKHMLDTSLGKLYYRTPLVNTRAFFGPGDHHLRIRSRTQKVSSRWSFCVHDGKIPRIIIIMFLFYEKNLVQQGT